MEQTICIFGDSIVVGSSDSEKGGWVSRLQNYFGTNNHNVDIHNFGVCGNTTSDLLIRFKTECSPIAPSIIVFAIGINDSKDIGRDNSQCIVPLESFQSNINELINQAREFTKKVIFVGLTNVDESKTMPVFWEGEDTNTFFSNAKVNLYNSKIEDIAQKNNLPFIDMLDLLNNSDLEDGLHPNSQGHEKMFLRVRDFLIANNII